jgi:hypothetical protein
VCLTLLMASVPPSPKKQWPNYWIIFYERSNLYVNIPIKSDIIPIQNICVFNFNADEPNCVDMFDKNTNWLTKICMFDDPSPRRNVLWRLRMASCSMLVKAALRVVHNATNRQQNQWTLARVIVNALKFPHVSKMSNFSFNIFVSESFWNDT